VTIIGYMPFLMGKFKDEKDPAFKALKAMKKQGEALSLLVDKLLRFTLLESEATDSELKETNLSITLKNSLRALEAMIKANNAEITCSEKMPSVLADAMKLQEIFENLLENAIKFNDKDKKTVKISAEPGENGFVNVKVADNGIGIPPEELEKVFQKFYQIEEQFTGQVEGIGLGLSLVKQLVESSGGKISVESRIGEGSTFIFTLPKA